MLVYVPFVHTNTTSLTFLLKLINDIFQISLRNHSYEQLNPLRRNAILKTKVQVADFYNGSEGHAVIVLDCK